MLSPYSAFRADLIRIQGYDQPLMIDLNPVSGVLPPGVFTCNEQNIDPDADIGLPCHLADGDIGSIAALTTEGRNSYTGLSLNYRWQRDESWFRTSYTWSRSEDTGFDPLKGGIALPPDSLDLGSEEGRSDSDREHRLVLSGDTALPWWGLRASGVWQLSSGLAYNVTTGQDDNLDGILSDRPLGVGRNAGEDALVAAINAVRDQPVVPLAPISSVPDEPIFFQFDLRLYRSFQFSNQRMKGDIYLQVFNLFDRENVALIEGRAISPSFGEPIALAGPPRTLELGLRIAY
jgi:hypothetical protein